MSGPNVVELLGNTLSPDANTRSQSTTALETLQASSYSGYLESLSAALSSSSTPSHIRNAAGLAIKNSLSAREGARNDSYAQRWKSNDLVPEATRAAVKTASLQTLADPDARVRTVAGQITAAIAQIEIPTGAWNDLIPTLLGFVAQQENTGLRQAALQAIGFVCEGMVYLDALLSLATYVTDDVVLLY